LDDLLSGLCNHYAPFVIPYVQEQTGLEDSEFIAVRLISGGTAFEVMCCNLVLSQILLKFECGDRLDTITLRAPQIAETR
jgi:hypothetical protein